MGLSQDQIRDHIASVEKRLSSDKERKLRGYEFAKLCYQVKDFEKAIGFLKGYLEVKPKDFRAHMWMARLYEIVKDQLQAIFHYEKFLDLKGDQKDIVLKVAELHLGLKDSPVDQLKKYLEKAKSVSGTHPLVFSLKERLHAVEGKPLDHLAQEKFLKQELSTCSGDPSPHVRLVHHYEGYGKIQEAYQFCKAVSRNGNLDENAEWLDCFTSVCEKYLRHTKVTGMDLPPVKLDVLVFLLWHTILQFKLELKYLYGSVVVSRTSTRKILGFILKVDQGLHEAYIVLKSISVSEGRSFYRMVVRELCGQLYLMIAQYFYLVGHSETTGQLPSLEVQLGDLCLMSSLRALPSKVQMVTMDTDPEKWYNVACTRQSVVGWQTLLIATHRTEDYFDGIVQLFKSKGDHFVLVRSLLKNVSEDVKSTGSEAFDLKKSFLAADDTFLQKTSLPEVDDLNICDRECMSSGHGDLSTLMWLYLVQKATGHVPPVSDWLLLQFPDLPITAQDLLKSSSSSLSKCDFEALFILQCHQSELKLTSSPYNLSLTLREALVMSPPCCLHIEESNSKRWMELVNFATDKIESLESPKNRVRDHLSLIRGCIPVQLSMDELLVLARHFKAISEDYGAVKQDVGGMKKYRECFSQWSNHYWSVLSDLIMSKSKLGKVPSKRSKEVDIIFKEAKLALGHAALRNNDTTTALQHFSCVNTPRAAWNQSQIYSLLADENGIAEEKRIEHLKKASKALALAATIMGPSDNVEFHEKVAQREEELQQLLSSQQSQEYSLVEDESPVPQLFSTPTVTKNNKTHQKQHDNGLNSSVGEALRESERKIEMMSQQLLQLKAEVKGLRSGSHHGQTESSLPSEQASISGSSTVSSHLSNSVKKTPINSEVMPDEADLGLSTSGNLLLEQDLSNSYSSQDSAVDADKLVSDDAGKPLTKSNTSHFALGNVQQYSTASTSTVAVQPMFIFGQAIPNTTLGIPPFNSNSNTVAPSSLLGAVSSSNTGDGRILLQSGGTGNLKKFDPFASTKVQQSFTLDSQANTHSIMPVTFGLPVSFTSDSQFRPSSSSIGFMTTSSSFVDSVPSCSYSTTASGAFDLFTLGSATSSGLAFNSGISSRSMNLFGQTSLQVSQPPAFASKGQSKLLTPFSGSGLFSTSVTSQPPLFGGMSLSSVPLPLTGSSLFSTSKASSQPLPLFGGQSLSSLPVPDLKSTLPSTGVSQSPVLFESQGLFVTPFTGSNLFSTTTTSQLPVFAGKSLSSFPANFSGSSLFPSNTSQLPLSVGNSVTSMSVPFSSSAASTASQAPLFAGKSLSSLPTTSSLFSTSAGFAASSASQSPLSTPFTSSSLFPTSISQLPHCIGKTSASLSLPFNNSGLFSASTASNVGFLPFSQTPRPMMVTNTTQVLGFMNSSSTDAELSDSLNSSMSYPSSLSFAPIFPLSNFSSFTSSSVAMSSTPLLSTSKTGLVSVTTNFNVLSSSVAVATINTGTSLMASRTTTSHSVPLQSLATSSSEPPARLSLGESSVQNVDTSPRVGIGVRSTTLNASDSNISGLTFSNTFSLNSSANASSTLKLGSSSLASSMPALYTPPLSSLPSMLPFSQSSFGSSNSFLSSSTVATSQVKSTPVFTTTNQESHRVPQFTEFKETVSTTIPSCKSPGVVLKSPTTVPESVEATPSSDTAASVVDVDAKYSCSNLKKLLTEFVSDSEDSEVSILYEELPDPELIIKAKSLMLPPSFYLYDKKPLCPGCRGCSEDPEATSTNNDKWSSSSHESVVSTNNAPPAGAAYHSKDDIQVKSFSSSGMLSFADIMAKPGNSTIGFEKTSGFQFQGSGSQLFSQKQVYDDENTEYEPDVYFKPLVTLPDSYDYQSADKDGEVLFEQRCKLYRYDDLSKQWKERGIGNVKIFLQMSDQNPRIIMRRDQTLKLCCNHYITKDMKLLPKDNDRSWAWHSHSDYSDEIAKEEKFVVKFKSASLACSFRSVFQSCVENLLEIKTKVVTQVQPSSVDQNKSEKWECDICYVYNSTEDSICVSCSAPKPGVDHDKTEVVEPPSSANDDVLESVLADNVSDSVTKSKEQANDKEEIDTKISVSIIRSTPVTCAGSSLEIEDDHNQNIAPDNIHSYAVDPEEVRPDTESLVISKPDIRNNGNSESQPKSFSSGGMLSFSDILAKECDPAFGFKKKSGFQFDGSGSQLFSAKHTDEGENEEYEPDVYFKPVITLSESYEYQSSDEGDTLFENRCKLFRYDQPSEQWKERGVGNIRIFIPLSNKKPRIIMRRDQILKLCCNHYITNDMKLLPKDNDKCWVWHSYSDYSEEFAKDEKFAVKFKTASLANSFKSVFENCVEQLCENTSETEVVKQVHPVTIDQVQLDKWECSVCYVYNDIGDTSCVACTAPNSKLDHVKTVAVADTKDEEQEIITSETSVLDSSATAKNEEQTKEKDINANIPGSISTSTSPIIYAGSDLESKDDLDQVSDSSIHGHRTSPEAEAKNVTEPSPVSKVSDDDKEIDGHSTQPMSFSSSKVLSFADITKQGDSAIGFEKNTGLQVGGSGTQLLVIKQDTDDSNEEYEPNLQFKPLVTLPDTYEYKSGDEASEVVFEQRCKLYRHDPLTKQWKERGVGEIQIFLQAPNKKPRIVMRRDQTLKVCCNHLITRDMKLIPKDNEKTWVWHSHSDYSDEEAKEEKFTVRFKYASMASGFKEAFQKCLQQLTKIEHHEPDSLSENTKFEVNTRSTEIISPNAEAFDSKKLGDKEIDLESGSKKLALSSNVKNEQSEHRSHSDNDADSTGGHGGDAGIAGTSVDHDTMPTSPPAVSVDTELSGMKSNDNAFELASVKSQDSNHSDENNKYLAGKDEEGQQDHDLPTMYKLSDQEESSDTHDAYKCISPSTPLEQSCDEESEFPEPKKTSPIHFGDVYSAQITPEGGSEDALLGNSLTSSHSDPFVSQNNNEKPLEKCQMDTVYSESSRIPSHEQSNTEYPMSPIHSDDDALGISPAGGDVSVSAPCSGDPHLITHLNDDVSGQFVGNIEAVESRGIRLSSMNKSESTSCDKSSERVDAPSIDQVSKDVSLSYEDSDEQGVKLRLCDMTTPLSESEANCKSLVSQTQLAESLIKLSADAASEKSKEDALLLSHIVIEESSYVDSESNLPQTVNTPIKPSEASNSAATSQRSSEVVVMNTKLSEDSSGPPEIQHWESASALQMSSKEGTETSEDSPKTLEVERCDSASALQMSSEDNITVSEVSSEEHEIEHCESASALQISSEDGIEVSEDSSEALEAGRCDSASALQMSSEEDIEVLEDSSEAPEIQHCQSASALQMSREEVLEDSSGAPEMEQCESASDLRLSSEEDIHESGPQTPVGSPGVSDSDHMPQTPPSSPEMPFLQGILRKPNIRTTETSEVTGTDTNETIPEISEVGDSFGSSGTSSEDSGKSDLTNLDRHIISDGLSDPSESAV